MPASPHDRGADLRRTAAAFPAIIVMPDGGAIGFYSNWWNGGRRGDPGWERYHLDELTRLVERRLRVRRGRRFHAIAGWSMGGYGAAFYASQRPGYFGLAASLSGLVSPQRDSSDSPVIRVVLDRPAVLLERAQPAGAGAEPPLDPALRAGRRRRPPRGGGGGEPHRDTQERQLRAQAREFVAAARRVGGPLRFEINPGIHAALNNRRSLADALRWARRAFRKPLPQRPRRWSYRTVAKSSKAFGFRFWFRRAPTEVVAFSLRRHRLTARGSGTVRVRTPAARRFEAKLPFRRHVQPAR